jgi:archaeal flagellin FlaB
MVRFCSHCGKPLEFETAEICPHCGVRINSPAAIIKKDSKRSIIVLIAAGIGILFLLIIIAAVFSYIVLGSGFFTAQQDQQTLYQDVEQSTANIQMIGNVYGFASNPSAGIDEIRFTIGLAPGALPVDLTKMKIVFSTPSTTPILLTQGTTATSSIFTTVQGVSHVNSMNANEQVEISFKTAPVTANTRMNIELRPPAGAALPFRKTAPQTISKANVLY